ncbi:unnamed protein product [Ambrosiozyma monospora]|uniref:1,3-beta-glucanosyltransferase n=1 Tax=Ambrosiozyma monospora TaxID=43982 RepID=A0A9W6Z3H5_AMBMO|nr:unnamed protein product [Ambrosiozyma monospora]
MVSLSKSVLSSIYVSLLASSVNALIPIEIVGKRFIKPAPKEGDEGEVFFIKGVDYMPGGASGYSSNSKSDVLSDADACMRDAYLLQKLGANTIRIYSINPDVNHDECMSIFNSAGIYVILDVNSSDSGEYLDRENPSSTYNGQYLENVFKRIEAFKNFPNLLGFFAGNEVINDQGNSVKNAPPYVRAVQRDMKQYIAKHADRAIPVGYSAAEIDDLRAATYEYFQCNIDGDEKDESKSDFYGVNSYSWCSGSSDWGSSGYSKVNSTFQDSSIPVFFSEYGCNKITPRTFDEVSEGVYSGLIDTLSGGLIYEFSEEANHYGLVDLGTDGSATLQDDFDNLQSQYNKTDIPDISESDVEDPTLSTCNSTKIQSLYKGFGNFTLPDQPDEVSDMIDNGLNSTNVGKLVEFDNSPSNYTITDADGNEITDASISINPTATINEQQTTAVPTEASTTKSASATANAASSSSSSHSSSKGAAAGNFEINAGGLMFMMGVGIAALL